MALSNGAGGGSNTTHVVVVPFPAQGHLSPLLHLCKRLASHGILITIALVESMHKQMLSTWKPQPNIRLDSIPFDFNIPFGYDANVQSNLKVEFNTAFSSLGPEFERLFRRLEPAPVCIIADDFIAWSRFVWRSLGVPLITYWPGSASWSSLHQHVDLLASNGDCGPLRDSSREVVDYVPGLTPIKLADLPDYFQYVDKDSLVVYCKLRVEDARLVIVNSFYELEPRTYDAMKEILGPKFVSIGPLFPLEIQSKDAGSINTSLRPEEEDCIKWLDSQSAGSVLYISFGSCSSMSGKESEEFVLGLAASKQRFLWVLNKEVVNEDEYERCVELTREHGMIVPWVPQLRVLAHTAVGGFLTHCGWNSLFESICSGVPMLCFPRHSDQPFNCKLVVEDWKIGLRLNQYGGGPLEKEKVASVIQEFMSDQEIRTNVSKLQMAAREATQSGGSSSANVDHLFQVIKSL